MKVLWFKSLQIKLLIMLSTYSFLGYSIELKCFLIQASHCIYVCIEQELHTSHLVSKLPCSSTRA